jgi:DNA repair photolyase
MIKIVEIQAKSILNKSKIYDYCVNCYTGCQVNCRYCYARLFMCRYSGHTEPWGAFVDVKSNAADLLEKQVGKARKGTVWLSSVCDPYEPAESKYRLTRRSLEILANAHFPVVVQTKSVLVLRDIDIFQKFEDIEVGFTITTADERIAGIFEPGAAPVAERIRALEVLHDRGISTFAFLGPLLPGNPESLAAALAGKVDRVLIDRMNYIDTIRDFYARLNLQEATTNAFFARQTARLTNELKLRGITGEVVY